VHAQIRLGSLNFSLWHPPGIDQESSLSTRQKRGILYNIFAVMVSNVKSLRVSQESKLLKVQISACLKGANVGRAQALVIAM
jgi:hypothetical protein